jgi:hypothetical protein
MTANVISTGVVASTDDDVSAPVIARTEHEDGSLVDDATIGRAGVYGMVGGTLVMTLLMFVFGLLAGLDATTSVAVAPVPGVVAGLFFGMTAYLGRSIARNEH